ncbi:hypothetical protein OSTOST_02399 [Ostertagia ostertagi]
MREDRERRSFLTKGTAKFLEQEEFFPACENVELKYIRAAGQGTDVERGNPDDLVFVLYGGLPSMCVHYGGRPSMTHYGRRVIRRLTPKERGAERSTVGGRRKAPEEKNQEVNKMEVEGVGDKNQVPVGACTIDRRNQRGEGEHEWDISLRILREAKRKASERRTRFNSSKDLIEDLHAQLKRVLDLKAKTTAWRIPTEDCNGARGLSSGDQTIGKALQHAQRGSGAAQMEARALSALEQTAT